MALNAVFSISLNHTVGNGLNLSQKISFNVESVKIGQSAIFNDCDIGRYANFCFSFVESWYVLDGFIYKSLDVFVVCFFYLIKSYCGL
jgi:hypothetical protein